MELQDRVAIVTGASRGIGREIALGYARAEAHVVLCARAAAHLQAVADVIHRAGGACSVQPLDVTDYAAVRKLVDGVVSEHGRIDVLCNNAGVSSARGPVNEVSPERLVGVYAVNVFGLYACCHAVLPHMFENGYGRIVNISSGSAFSCEPASAAYSSSKAAVNALTIVLAKEARDHNVLVNVMSPGSVRTDMNPTGQTEPVEAVPTAIWLAALPADGPTGRFYRFLQEIPMLPQVDIDWSAR